MHALVSVQYRADLCLLRQSVMPESLWLTLCCFTGLEILELFRLPAACCANCAFVFRTISPSPSCSTWLKWRVPHEK